MFRKPITLLLSFCFATLCVFNTYAEDIQYTVEYSKDSRVKGPSLKRVALRLRIYANDSSKKEQVGVAH